MPNENPTKFRILIAEDNTINQLITVQMLKIAGYRADVVANGREVLLALNSISYDLILMDCQMPEMDGYEATRILRQQQSKLPIIALTANAFKEDRIRCLESGMSDYLTKPLDRFVLISAVDRWLKIS